MEQIAIFIDGSNLYYTLRGIYKKSQSLLKFDFEKFIALISHGRKVARTYYYTASLDRKKDPITYAKQQQFFEQLKKIPDFELVLCRMQKENIDGKTVYTVKEDDIHLAIDMLKLAYRDAYEVALLISNDADFVPAIKAVKEQGKKVENVVFEKKFSWHLKQACDRFKQINKMELDTCFFQNIEKKGDSREL